MSPSTELVTGSLLGVACGDALGAPFEGHPQPSLPQIQKWIDSDAPLQYTDDTAMTIVLAQHLHEHAGHVDDDALVMDFAHAWRHEPHRGYGAGPPAIFTAALAGDDWRAVAHGLFGGTGSLGNGGAMRAAPTAFVHGTVTERVARARQQAAVTHSHPLAQDGAALLCASVAIAADTAAQPFDPMSFLTLVRGHIATHEFREALQAVHAAVRQQWTPAQVAQRLGHDITALGSVPSALVAFLLHPDELPQALTFALEVGGDTDTIAAMTGAISGARSGAEAFPPRWLQRLENEPTIRRLAHTMKEIPT
ncbi:ADP-ribosylglycohydrolase family protein [Nocardioides pakistanensis]